MPLVIHLSVNGRTIDQIAVRNVGHPDTGDHPADDDLRRYRVTDESNGRVVHVVHRRSAGARALAASAIAELERAQSWVAAVHQVLVDECGAAPDGFDDFAHHWPACGEDRFVGTLGFGGKVWSGRGDGPPYVTQYPEDATPRTIEAIERANRRLAAVAPATEEPR
jgi:hypothetical protein